MSDKYGCLFWIIVILAMWITFFLFYGCKSHKPLISENSKVNTEILNTYKDFSISSFNDSLNLQRAYIGKLITEQNYLQQKINVLNERIKTLETTNIQEREYYETGVLKYERLTDNKKQTTHNYEQIENINIQKQYLEQRYDSLNLCFTELNNKYVILKNEFDEKIKQEKLELSKQESPKDPYRYRYIFYIVAILFVSLIFINWSKIFSLVKKILKQNKQNL